MLLAGGRARRMGGGDKALMLLAGRPLLAHVVERIGPQCAALVVNANGDPERFAGFGLPVVADSIEGGLGPLAGILAGLEWAARHRPELSHVLSVPCDTPDLPCDLVERLAGAIDADNLAACAASGGRLHPVVGLWPAAWAGDLRQALERDALRRADDWARRAKVAIVPFDPGPPDPFANLNTLAELRDAALSRRPTAG